MKERMIRRSRRTGVDPGPKSNPPGGHGHHPHGLHEGPVYLIWWVIILAVVAVGYFTTVLV